MSTAMYLRLFLEDGTDVTGAVVDLTDDEVEELVDEIGQKLADPEGYVAVLLVTGARAVVASARIRKVVIMVDAGSPLGRFLEAKP